VGADFRNGNRLAGLWRRLPREVPRRVDRTHAAARPGAARRPLAARRKLAGRQDARGCVRIDDGRRLGPPLGRGGPLRAPGGGWGGRQLILLHAIQDLVRPARNRRSRSVLGGRPNARTGGVILTD
jgi:hypothetical protein